MQNFDSQNLSAKDSLLHPLPVGVATELSTVNFANMFVKLYILFFKNLSDQFELRPVTLFR